MSTPSTSPASLPVSLLLGGASLGTGGFAAFHDEEQLGDLLSLFKEHGLRRIDTARTHPAPNASDPSEALIGRTPSTHSLDFIVDTKVRSMAVNHPHSEKEVRRSVQESLEALGGTRINTLYLHAPDRSTPFEVTLKTLNELYEVGTFNQLGLSNYTATEVETIVELCKKNSWIVPAVYQGEYNALCRRADTELFPMLRKHNISFVEFSPLAGGMLSGKLLAPDDKAAKGSRFDLSQKFISTYRNDEMYEAMNALVTFCASRKVTTPSVALQWLVFHSPLATPFTDSRKGEVRNGVILGGSRIRQYEDSFAALAEGPLDEEAVKAVEKAWDVVKDVAPPCWA